MCKFFFKDQYKGFIVFDLYVLIAKYFVKCEIGFGLPRVHVY